MKKKIWTTLRYQFFFLKIREIKKKGWKNREIHKIREKKYYHEKSQKITNMYQEIHEIKKKKQQHENKKNSPKTRNS